MAGICLRLSLYVATCVVFLYRHSCVARCVQKYCVHFKRNDTD